MARNSLFSQGVPGNDYVLDNNFLTWDSSKKQYVQSLRDLPPNVKLNAGLTFAPTPATGPFNTEVNALQQFLKVYPNYTTTSPDKLRNVFHAYFARRNTPTINEKSDVFEFQEKKVVLTEAVSALLLTEHYFDCFKYHVKAHDAKANIPDNVDPRIDDTAVKNILHTIENTFAGTQGEHNYPILTHLMDSAANLLWLSFLTCRRAAGPLDIDNIFHITKVVDIVFGGNGNGTQYLDNTNMSRATAAYLIGEVDKRITAFEDYQDGIDNSHFEDFQTANNSFGSLFKLVDPNGIIYGACNDGAMESNYHHDRYPWLWGIPHVYDDTVRDGIRAALVGNSNILRPVLANMLSGSMATSMALASIMSTHNDKEPAGPEPQYNISMSQLDLPNPTSRRLNLAGAHPGTTRFMLPAGLSDLTLKGSFGFNKYMNLLVTNDTATLGNIYTSLGDFKNFGSTRRIYMQETGAAGNIEHAETELNLMIGGAAAAATTVQLPELQPQISWHNYMARFKNRIYLTFGEEVVSAGLGEIDGQRELNIARLNLVKDAVRNTLPEHTWRAVFSRNESKDNRDHDNAYLEKANDKVSLHNPPLYQLLLKTLGIMAGCLIPIDPKTVSSSTGIFMEEYWNILYSLVMGVISSEKQLTVTGDKSHQSIQQDLMNALNAIHRFIPVELKFTVSEKMFESFVSTLAVDKSVFDDKASVILRVITESRLTPADTTILPGMEYTSSQVPIYSHDTDKPTIHARPISPAEKASFGSLVGHAALSNPYQHSAFGHASTKPPAHSSALAPTSSRHSGSTLVPTSSRHSGSTLVPTSSRPSVSTLAHSAQGSQRLDPVHDRRGSVHDAESGGLVRTSTGASGHRGGGRTLIGGRPDTDFANWIRIQGPNVLLCAQFLWNADVRGDIESDGRFKFKPYEAWRDAKGKEYGEFFMLLVKFYYNYVDKNSQIYKNGTMYHDLIGTVYADTALVPTRAQVIGNSTTLNTLGGLNIQIPQVFSFLQGTLPFMQTVAIILDQNNISVNNRSSSSSIPTYSGSQAPPVLRGGGNDNYKKIVASVLGDDFKEYSNMIGGAAYVAVDYEPSKFNGKHLVEKLRKELKLRVDQLKMKGVNSNEDQVSQLEQQLNQLETTLVGFEEILTALKSAVVDKGVDPNTIFDIQDYANKYMEKADEIKDQYRNAIVLMGNIGF